MMLVIARPEFLDQLAAPEPALMIVEQGPAINPREVEREERQRVLVGAHMTEKLQICRASIPLPAAAIDAIGIVMRAAACVAVILCAIHEDAILAVGFGHRGE